MKEFREKLAATGITDPRRIHNCDETGLLYRALPTYTYVKREDAGTVRGSKAMEAKDRLTVQLVVSAAGEKGPLFVIGKQAKPRCFSGTELPADVLYTSNKAAWMNTDTFQYWFNTCYLPWKRRIWGAEKTVLVMDNCPAHKLSNVPDDVVPLWLPPNLTSIYQPLDQGIIHAVKRRYKTAMVEQLADILDVSVPSSVYAVLILRLVVPCRRGRKSVRGAAPKPTGTVVSRTATLPTCWTRCSSSPRRGRPRPPRSSSTASSRRAA